MADLPDLDTSNIGLAAYWNVIDDGGVLESEYDPSEALTNGAIESYTLYDNGWEAEVMPILNEPDNGLPFKPETIKMRAKTDGWMVVYIDDTVGTNGTFSGSSSDTNPYADGLERVVSHPYHRGHFDTSPAAVDPDGFKVMLEHVIGDFSSISPTFNYSDVGMYAYNWSDATNLSLLSAFQSGGNSSANFTVATGTDVKLLMFGGYSDDGDSRTSVDLTLPGGTTNVVAEAEQEIGRLDLTGSVDLGSQYDITYGEYATMWNIVLWS